MKEIKFRVWLNEENHYLYDGFGFFQNADEIEIYNDDGDEVTNFVIEQYTGLKDKNGKEIYEGDILSFVYRPTRETKENYRGVIEFGNPNGAYNWGWQIRFIGTQPLTAKDILFWIEDIYTDCEVIGNIHENANLLKEETK